MSLKRLIYKRKPEKSCEILNNVIMTIQYSVYSKEQVNIGFYIVNLSSIISVLYRTVFLYIRICHAEGFTF